MLRTILFCIAALLTVVIIGLPVMLIILLVKLFSKRASRILTYGFVGFVMRVFLPIAGTKINLVGKENIPPKVTPVLFVSNHRSYFDIITAYVAVPGYYGFVGKKEFKKVPVMSWWMLLLGCIFLDRSNPREGLRTINKAVDEVKEGYSIWICPEGTRGHEEKVLPFKEGSFKIAEKAGVPVVPVAFVHTDDILENHMPKLQKQTITIAVGKPIETAGLSRPELKTLHQQVYDEIQRMYDENV